eukprot:GHVL01009153.1.p1 GENE.GHVL01009153.1~~GHVL01009153.1.p1  ORF type:complete len:290 (-),score=40.10 GHVL01009153.1:1121-1990(-)
MLLQYNSRIILSIQNLCYVQHNIRTLFDVANISSVHHQQLKTAFNGPASKYAALVKSMVESDATLLPSIMMFYRNHKIAERKFKHAIFEVLTEENISMIEDVKGLVFLIEALNEMKYKNTDIYNLIFYQISQKVISMESEMALRCLNSIGKYKIEVAVSLKNFLFDKIADNTDELFQNSSEAASHVSCALMCIAYHKNIEKASQVMDAALTHIIPNIKRMTDHEVSLTLSALSKIKNMEHDITIIKLLSDRVKKSNDSVALSQGLLAMSSFPEMKSEATELVNNLKKEV